MTGNELRKKVVSIIGAWVGGTKGSPKHLDILATYNGHKPLARGYAVKASDAYCATTVSAAYIQAGISDYTGTECGVERFVQIAKAKGIWTESDAHVPMLGDACVYDWDDSGSGDCVGAGDHIGIVSAAGSDTFTVVEGNMSGGKVGKRQVPLNGKFIRGFITPDFAAIAAQLSAGERNEEGEEMDLEKFKKLYAEMRAELKDNDASQYSEEARTWAVNSGLIAGNGTTVNGEPNCMWEDTLTREQLVTVLYRFAHMMGKA